MTPVQLAPINDSEPRPTGGRCALSALRRSGRVTLIGSACEEHSSLSVPLSNARSAGVAGELVTRESRNQATASPNPRRLKSKFPTCCLSTMPLRDVGGDSMAREWGISEILLAAAVVVLALAAVGVGIGDLNLIALGLALGFASFIV